MDVPKDLKLNLMSGSSISVSWNPVEGASSYTLSVVPTPTMENDYTVHTDFAFIDGLSMDTEYTIRVRAQANGVDSALSAPLKVTPTGAPIIAPAPRVVSYDETSVSLSRPHLHHYRNGNDFTRIYVQVIDSTGARQELEFPVPFHCSFSQSTPCRCASAVFIPASATVSAGASPTRRVHSRVSRRPLRRCDWRHVHHRPSHEQPSLSLRWLSACVAATRCCCCSGTRFPRGSRCSSIRCA